MGTTENRTRSGEKEKGLPLLQAHAAMLKRNSSSELIFFHTGKKAYVKGSN